MLIRYNACLINIQKLAEEQAKFRTNIDQFILAVCRYEAGAQGVSFPLAHSARVSGR